MVPTDSHRITRVPRYSGYHYLTISFPYGAITRYGTTFQWLPVRSCSNVVALQPRHRRNGTGLGWSDFARRYSRNHYCFLLLRVLRCFSSPGLPPCGYYIFNIVGCPIRIPADQLVCANPRSFSQLIASFIASESLGIPHTLLFSLLCYLSFLMSLSTATGARVPIAVFVGTSRRTCPFSCIFLQYVNELYSVQIICTSLLGHFQ